MKLYYYKDKKGNFGDDLNVWLWDRLLPGAFDDDDNSIFIGIGTLLNHLLPDAPLKVVFSAGVGYKNPPPPVNGSWKIYCVRGPRSAAKLSIDPKLAATDGAALLKTLDIPPQHKQYAVSFIPHHQSVRPKWGWFCRKVGIHYIDPSGPVDTVIAQIAKSKLVIAEAMHGAIVADTLRVPWIPVKLHSHILDFKWHDWCESLGMSYRPVHLPAVLKSENNFKYYVRFKYSLISIGMRWVAKTVPPGLSHPEALEASVSQLQTCLQQFKKDFL